MSLNFLNHQCVIIKDSKEFEFIREYLRNPNGSSPHESAYPIYLEWAESVTRGRSIGIVHQPINTWTRKPMEVLTVEQALK